MLHSYRNQSTDLQWNQWTSFYTSRILVWYNLNQLLVIQFHSYFMTSFMGFTQVVLALLKIFSYTAIQIVRTIFGEYYQMIIYAQLWVILIHVFNKVWF